MPNVTIHSKITDKMCKGEYGITFQEKYKQNVML